MRPHRVPPTTHTVEMAQIAEINDRLSGEPKPVVTAAELGLDGVRVSRPRGSGALQGSAVLARLAWDGAPEFPDIHAQFTQTAEAGTVLVVDLHTATLRTLSHRLGLHHAWGIGNV